jgi:hypothetical protein
MHSHSGYHAGGLLVASSLAVSWHCGTARNRQRLPHGPVQDRTQHDKGYEVVDVHEYTTGGRECACRRFAAYVRMAGRRCQGGSVRLIRVFS